MKLHNYMEELVSETMDKLLLNSKEYCDCPKCRLDAMAWALNRLPPKYVVTQKGNAYTKLQLLEMQFQADVIAEVTHAMNHIAKTPRH